MSKRFLARFISWSLASNDCRLLNLGLPVSHAIVATLANWNWVRTAQRWAHLQNANKLPIQFASNWIDGWNGIPNRRIKRCCCYDGLCLCLINCLLMRTNQRKQIAGFNKVICGLLRSLGKHSRPKRKKACFADYFEFAFCGTGFWRKWLRPAFVWLRIEILQHLLFTHQIYGFFPTKMAK